MKTAWRLRARCVASLGLCLTLLVLAPPARADGTCQLTGTGTCDAPGVCSPGVSIDCLEGGPVWDADDLVLVGTGANERWSLDLDSPVTGGTFTLTFDGETTAPILYITEPEPFVEPNGWDNGKRIEAALVALDTIDFGDVAVSAIQVPPFDEFEIVFKGSRSCTDVPDPSADLAGLSGAPLAALSLDDTGDPGTGADVTLTQSLAQGTDPTTGWEVRCDGRLALTTPMSLTLGPAGLTVDYGAMFVARGDVLQVGSPSPGFQSSIDPNAEWTLGSVSQCSGNCSSTPELRRLELGGQPFAAEALANLDPAHAVVFFHPGSNSADEGFMYWVTAADGSGGTPFIEIDQRQSRIDDQDGFVDRKLIHEVTFQAGASAGNRMLTLTVDSPIEADHQYAGHWIEIAGVPYLIQDTRDNGAGDVITLIDHAGLVAAVASGSTALVYIANHRPGDVFSVVNANWLRSSTAHATDPDDSPVFFRGSASDVDFLVLDDLSHVRFSGLQGEVGHLWAFDGHGPTGEDNHRFLVEFSQDARFRWLQGTGGPAFHGTASGYHQVLSTGPRRDLRYDWISVRHTQDDCHWQYKGQGNADDVIRIGTLRCEHASDKAHSGNALDGQHPFAYSVGTATCLLCTSAVLDNGPFCWKRQELDVESVFTLISWPPDICGHSVRNLYAVGNVGNTETYTLHGNYSDTLIEDLQLGTNLLGGKTDHAIWRRVAIRDVEINNSPFIHPLSSSGVTTVLDFEDIVLADIVRVPPNPNGSQRMFRLDCQNQLLANRLLWYFRDPVAASQWGTALRQDCASANPQGWNALAFVGMSDPNDDASGTHRALQSDNVPDYASVVWGPDGPYFLDVKDPADNEAALPPTAVIGPGPPRDPNTGLLPPLDGGVIADLGFGNLRAGVCQPQRWHHWYGIPPEQTCIGTATGGSSLRFEGGDDAGHHDRVRFVVGSNDAPDDVQQPLDVGDPVDSNDGSWTLELWLRAQAGENPAGAGCGSGSQAWADCQVLVDRSEADDGFGELGLGVCGDGALRGGVEVGGSSGEVCAPEANLLDARWHHVVWTRDGSTGELCVFIDGVEAECASGPPGAMSYDDTGSDGSADGQSATLYVGGAKEAGDPAFAGWVDDLRFTSRVRYASCGAGLPCFAPPSAALASDPDVVGLYRFDDAVAGSDCDCAGPLTPLGDAGSCVTDSSGLAQHGECRFDAATGGPSYSDDAPHADPDADAVAGVDDNCALVHNPSQSDIGGALGAPDGLGDACQCGDANGDGQVDAKDVTAAELCTTAAGTCLPTCDADASATCEAADAGAIESALAGLGVPSCHL